MAQKKKMGIKVPTKNEIFKKYGNMLSIPSQETKPILWLPSRFLALNHQFGGGIPFAKILEIIGEQSSGKSLMAYDFAYCAQQLGGFVIWVDAEQSWDNDWAEKQGIDLEKVIVLNSTKIEEISDTLADLAIYYRSQYTHNEPILVVVDSVAAIDCADNIDAKMVDGKSEMGGRAKALYKMLRIRQELFTKLGITQIYINQMRTALNVGFGKDNTTSTGGAGLKFYASIRCLFYSGRSVTKKIKGKERKIGKLVTIRMDKNKVAPPKETLSKCPVYFNAKYHEVGFDRYYLFDEVLIEEGVIEKSSGGVYKYKGKSIARGEEKFLDAIRDDDKLRRTLIRKSKVNTISQTQEKLEELEEKKINLYPVSDNIEYESQLEAEDSDEEEEEYDEE